MKFVRKVYSILAIQLSITAAFIIMVQTSQPLRHFFFRNIWLSIYCLFGSVISMFSIICCLGRTYPYNFVLLAIFTVCESFLVGGFTAIYNSNIVILAGLSTALVTISLTLYALRTKVKIEIFMALAFVIYFAMFPLIIIGAIFGIRAIHIIYCCLGLLMYSLFLIIDTIQICGNKKSMGGFEVDYNDYIIASL